MTIDLVIAISYNKVYNEKYKTFLLNTEKPLRYFFRGIAKYLNYINKLFIIVPPNYQLPTWLDISKFTIVSYNDLVDDSNLEYVDSSNVSVYCNKIKELSENYLFLDTSTFIINEVSPNTFFDEVTSQLKVKVAPEKPQAIDNQSKCIYEQYQNIFGDILEVPYILNPSQGVIPFNKNLWKEFYLENSNLDIKKGYAHYLFYFWGNLKNKINFTTNNLNTISFPVDSLWAGIINYDLLNNKKRQVVYINSLQTIEKVLHEDAEQWILEALEYRVGNTLCFYEKY